VIPTVLIAAVLSYGARIDLPHVDRAPAIDGSLNDPAWKAQAAKVALEWNLRDQQHANQATTAYITTDGTAIYVAFSASQTQPLRAGQHANDAGLNNDDTVTVYFWPGGSQGFEYSFSANPAGAHVASSSENTAYAPIWQSASTMQAQGYTVTMRIPLRVMKGAGNAPWGVQFSRFVSSTQDDFVWQHSAQQGPGSEAVSLYSGFLAGVPRQATLRPNPRAAVYALAAIAPRSLGGSTSRVGADFSIPLTNGTTLVATVHPDYSNVELDQQTIQPAVYARFLQEVRPFFTQLDNFFNNTPCLGCTGQELYSPRIPTPRDGYAIEGKHGPASFAAFSAQGAGNRSDSAQVVTLRSTDSKNAVSLQRVSVNAPGLYDDTMLVDAVHDSLRGLMEYVAYGRESGTFVRDGSEAQRREAGIGLYNRNGDIYLSERHIGSQYAPPDGLFQQNDISGYDINALYTWYGKTASLFPRIVAAANLDRYHGTGTGLRQSDTSLALGADIRSLWHIRLQTGSSYTRLSDSTFTPVTQNGVDLYYHYHTPTVAQISWYTGRFGPGRLDSWTRTATVRLGSRGYISVTADNNFQRLDRGSTRTLWLESAAFSYENGANSSIGIGVRRIIGFSPLLASGEGTFLNAWNIAFDYHIRMAHAELYLVYGGANALQTAPGFIIKLIQYAGADKGT
jgi:hypothetical protein